MISNALRSAVGEGGAAELERERRIGEPRGDDKVEDGAGVVSGERGGGSRSDVEYFPPRFRSIL